MRKKLHYFFLLLVFLIAANSGTTVFSDTHADVNGDGFVSQSDLDFTSIYFFQESEDTCPSPLPAPVIFAAQTEVEVTVELSPPMDLGGAPGTLTRCIIFKLYDCLVSDTEPRYEVCWNIDFSIADGVPTTGSVTLTIPPGTYHSITARDELHTLRSTTSMILAGGHYTADFTGDRSAGGHWLVGGDVSGDGFIDVVDISQIAILIGTDYGTGDTPCAVPPTPTPTSTPTPTPTPTPTSTSTSTPMPTLTPMPTPTTSSLSTPVPSPSVVLTATHPPPPPTPSSPCRCYVVAQSGGSGSTNLLSIVDPGDLNPDTNEIAIGDSTGTTGIEVIAYQKDTGILYAVNYNRLGVLDRNSGWFIPASQPIGSGDGKFGLLDFDAVKRGEYINDVDGLAFQPVSGILFGSVRRNGQDLLIQIDTATGRLIPGVFNGCDYLVIDNLIAGLDDIDDIAFDPNDGTLYAVQNNRGRYDHLVIIDIGDGSVIDVGPLTYQGVSLCDMEGLSFGCSGRLRGLTGDKAVAGCGDQFWEIDIITGTAGNPIKLGNGTDYEGLDCGFFVPPPSPTPPHRPILAGGDYNGDGTADIAIFRARSGLWAMRGITRAYFGAPGDVPVPGDYDGEGTDEIGIFRNTSGLWAIRDSTRLYFGSSFDIAVPGDYDGDGVCNIAVFRSSIGLWAIRGVTRVYFGQEGDNVAGGDFNGDGSADIAVFRSGSGIWAMRGISRIYFGGAGDTCVPGDYTGGGASIPGIFRPHSGLWAIQGVTRVYFGSGVVQPWPADYDGDGTVERGLFENSAGLWLIEGITSIYYGMTGDIPVTR